MSALVLALARSAELEARIAELEAKLSENSSNSSKPPSADPPGKPKRRRKKKSGRKRGGGGQKGHKEVAARCFPRRMPTSSSRSSPRTANAEPLCRAYSTMRLIAFNRPSCSCLCGCLTEWRRLLFVRRGAHPTHSLQWPHRAFLLSTRRPQLLPRSHHRRTWVSLEHFEELFGRLLYFRRASSAHLRPRRRALLRAARCFASAHDARERTERFPSYRDRSLPAKNRQRLLKL